jgi:hypothetical protein
MLDEGVFPIFEYASFIVPPLGSAYGHRQNTFDPINNDWAQDAEEKVITFRAARHEKSASRGQLECH